MGSAAKILIAGGGLGGLTAAIALRQSGLDAIVFEQADELREIGAGLTVWSNATRVLKKLGLLDAALERGAVLERLELRTWRGRGLAEIRAVFEFDTPSICIHRADLLAILKGNVPEDCICLGERIEGVEQHDRCVLARFSSGRTAEGCAVIGADGLFSVVRALVLGPSKPVYRGYHAWRGIANFTASMLRPSTAVETWGPGKRFGIEPMGRGRCFWYATANAPEGALGDQVGWKDELREAFRAWPHPIPELIEATEREAILKHGVFDRPPVRQWGHGCVTLLGDAAHPTTPNLGQGACMAIEDAEVLAKCLSQNRDVVTMLRRYESLRFRRTSFITLESRRIGQMGQWESPLGMALRTTLLKLTPAIFMEMRHRRYYSSEA